MKILLALFIAVVLAGSAATAQVRMEETTITIQTYPVGAPEPNPLFYTPEGYQGAQMHLYPYPYLGSLTDQKTDKSYKALVLENEYVYLVVLPELGGRLYVAQDKTNGYDFFYRNRVVKPALIGMTGAWMSGGVEWNIPHHHRASTFMPVDYRLVDNKDGSKSIWVGETEKRHGTRWSVTLTLYPGKAYVETTMRHVNTTPVAQSILMWANTATHANENNQVFFPPDVERATFHSKVDFTDWPIARGNYVGIDFSKGVDVSWWKNITSPTSFFAWDTQKDFVAGIDHGKKAGTVIVGNHHQFTGKKVWYWGNNEVQRLWDQMLTDEDGPYLELMMGLYSDNQPDYSWNDPFSTRSGTVYFLPVKDLSGIKEANRDLAVNLSEAGGNVTIEVYGTSPRKNVRILLSQPGREWLNETTSLDPARGYSRTIPVDDSFRMEEVKLSVVSPDGTELIAYRPESPRHKPEPDVYHGPGAPEDYNDPDELDRVASRLEQFGNPDFDPVSYYEEALRRNPDHVGANLHLGTWYLKRDRYEKAEPYLQKAVDQVTGNFTKARTGEPLYYLGLALYGQGRLDEAYDVLSRAAWNDETAAATHYLLGRIDARGGRFGDALDHLERALTFNGANAEARVLKAALLRHTGRAKEAAEIVDAVLAGDPINLPALAEKALQSAARSPQATAMATTFRNEPDNYLETAFRYGEAGLYADAVEILARAADSPDSALSANPMISYVRGSYFQQAGDREQAKASFARAAALPIGGIFPHGFTAAAALRVAQLYDPDDAHAWYLRGNVLADTDPETALAEWQEAARLDPGLALAYRNIAYLQANIFDQMDAALINVEKAITLDPSNPRFLYEADLYGAYTRRPPAERLALIDRYPGTWSAWYPLALRRIQLANFAGRYDEAIRELTTRHFYVAEISPVNPHHEWTSAYLYRGISRLAAGKADEALADFEAVLTFPRNLEVAYDSRSAAAYYWIGRTYTQLGRTEKAREAYSKLAGFENRSGWGAGDEPIVDYFRGLAYRAMGNVEAAEGVFSALFAAGRDALDDRPSSGLDLKGLRVRQDQRDEETRSWFRLALGRLGLGDRTEAEVLLHDVLDRAPAHIDAHNLLNNPDLHRLLEMPATSDASGR